MTIRNTKRLILVAVVLLVLVAILEVVVDFLKPTGRHDYFAMVMPLFLVVLFASTWQRLSKIEAEHGPDYAPPSPPYARKILIVAAIAAAILAAIAGYLIATH